MKTDSSDIVTEINEEKSSSSDREEVFNEFLDRKIPMPKQLETGVPTQRESKFEA